MLVPREVSVFHRSRIRPATRSAASSRHKGKPPGHLPKICTMHLPCAAQGATPRGFAQGRQRQHADPMQTGGTYHPEHIQGNPRLSQRCPLDAMPFEPEDRKSTRLNSSHSQISYAVFCLKKKKKHIITIT